MGLFIRQYYTKHYTCGEGLITQGTATPRKWRLREQSTQVNITEKRRNA